MPGQKREARLRADDPGIHVFLSPRLAKTWMAGPSPRRRGFGPAGGTSPAMTTQKPILSRACPRRADELGCMSRAEQRGSRRSRPASATGRNGILTERADSYVCGTADVPLLGDTIGRTLDLAVQRWGAREALVSPSHGVRWTWSEFAERVEAVAAGFLALGLTRGERIGIWSLNRPEWTLTQFAAAKAGLILVTINPAYRLTELEFALAKVGCAAVVSATAFKTSGYMEMLNTLLPELATSSPGHLEAARLPQLRAVIQIGGPISPGTIPFDEVAQMG